MVVFSESTPLRLIEAIRPDVLVKGGDYTEEMVVGAAEVRAWGGRVELIPLVEGVSTHASLLPRLRRRHREQNVFGLKTMSPLFFSVRLPTLLAIFWRVHVRRSSDQATVSQKEPFSFVVFRLDSLGDVVLTTPLFRALENVLSEVAMHRGCAAVLQIAAGH